MTRGRRMGWALFFAGLILFFLSIIAWGTCTTSWHSPSDDDSHGGMSWDNGAGGRTAYDGDLAYTTTNGQEHEFDEYGFTLGGDIPAAAVIVGFEIGIRGYSQGGGGKVRVALSWNGGSTIDMESGGMGRGVSSIVLPQGEGNIAWCYGELPNPPFIHTFTPDDVCDNDFTVWCKADVYGSAVYVDAVYVRVFYYDETATPNTPNNPTSVSSTTHSAGVWYNASSPEGTTITLQWNSATDRPTCDSGIDGYRIYWDTSSSTVLGATGGYYVDEDGAHTQDFTLANGQRWFHIRSVDNVGHLADNTKHTGPYQYDDTWPTNPNVTSSRSTVTWLNSADVPISVSGASDTPSGVDGFEAAWDHSGSWTHTSTKNREESWDGETYTLADGVWYFHLATVDNAGNWVSTSVYETEGWFGVDIHAPTDPTVTSPTHAEGSLSSNPNVQISVSDATDPQYGESGYENSSGVDGFSVAWDGSAVSPPDAVKDHEEDWTGKTYTLDDGKWYYHLRTKDIAGNWTSTEDYGPITIDTTDPTVTSLAESPTVIAKSTAGDKKFTLTIDFNEDMDTNVSPIIGFPVEDPTSTITLNTEPGGSCWSDSDTYVAYYDVTDANEEIAGIDVRVTGAKDIAGNTMEQYDEANVFSIDTVCPTITSLTSTTADGCYNVGESINVTVYFSEEVTLVGGTLDVTLDTGDVIGVGQFGPAANASASYTVGTDDNSCDLDATNVVQNGGTLQDNAGNDGTISLPLITIADVSDITVDTTDPTITWISKFPSATQQMDSDCSLEYPINIQVTDNCSIDINDVSFTVSNPSNATVTHTLEKKEIGTDGKRVDIIGSVTVSGLTSCPATVNLDVDAHDCSSNTADSEDTLTLSDSTQPTITWITDFPETEQLMDGDCSLTFPIEILVEDNCCINPEDVSFTLSDPADVTVADTLGKTGEPPNAVRIKGDVTLSSLTDGEAPVTLGVNWSDCCDNALSASDSVTVVDYTLPTISGLSVTPDDGLVDGACEEIVRIDAVVEDNCCISKANIVVTPTATNATIKEKNIVKIQDSDRQVTIGGTITVHSLTGCPATVRVEIRACDCGGNNSTWTEQAQVTDNVAPVIYDLRVDDQVAVDKCCEATVTFDGHVDDNCCIVPDGVVVTVLLPTSNAIVENIVVNRVQNGQGRVDLTGTADVRCLTSCPARVEVRVEAADCCGNSAIPVTSTTTEGRVYDETAPEARDDPQGKEDRRASDNLGVQADGGGQYRLVVYEGTPVHIDVAYNDSDNCSCLNHDPCFACSGCDAPLWIESIVDPPKHGTATLEDDERSSRGDPTCIRYTPYHGYYGEDEFTYQIIDACGNVSGLASVCLEVIPLTVLNDIYLTTCLNTTVSFMVEATDPRIDPDNPGMVPFVFSIAVPPTHGVITGDVGAVTYEARGNTNSATITLAYTPAAGFTGRDALTLHFADPFGGSSGAVVDIAVVECQGKTGAPGPFALQKGEIFLVIVPLTFAVVYGEEWHTVTLQALDATGKLYNEALSAEWEESIGRYVLRLDTASLPPGLYQMTVPLGNGETVTMMIEVVEAV